MKAVIQLVTQAQVCVEGETIGACGRGYMILLGVGTQDTEADAAALAQKIVKLRIFPDEEGRLNRSITDVNGEILVVSQFTLYANYVHGNRPDYLNAARPETAVPLYESFVAHLRERVPRVETGEFGADMQISLTNDGPVTIVMESELLKK